MRIRTKLPTADELNSYGSLVSEPVLYKGKWRELFNGGERLYLELGCGRGGFAVESALADTHINLIGAERSKKVILMALKEAQNNNNPPNLKFINTDAAVLCDCFENGELDRIYIHFCDPWRNRAKWFKRRLTHRDYLAVYEKLLVYGGSLIFKTDEKNLFDFSLREFAETGWTERVVTRDLHKNALTVEIMTEYEKRYVGQGKPIYMTEVIRPL